MNVACLLVALIILLAIVNHNFLSQLVYSVILLIKMVDTSDTACWIVGSEDVCLNL